MRTAFVLVCLVPCVVLAAWAAYRSSPLHRDLATMAWARQIGLNVGCDRIDHVRPGCVRLSKCELRADDGSVVASFDVVEVETTPTEVRIRLPVFHATNEACAAVGRMARNWLTEPARHPRAWLVEVASVRWQHGFEEQRGLEEKGELKSGVRVECVAVGAERAVRIRREPATNDEVRIVRSADGERGRFTVEARVDEPVPAACVLAAIGRPTPEPRRILGGHRRRTPSRAHPHPLCDRSHKPAEGRADGDQRHAGNPVVSAFRKGRSNLYTVGNPGFAGKFGVSPGFCENPRSAGL